MVEKKQLNADIAGTISEFEALMREFLIRNVIYRIIFRGTTGGNQNVH